MSSRSSGDGHAGGLISVVASVIVWSLVSCGGHAPGFESACDHADDAVKALADGDAAKAKAEVLHAREWMEAAAEDTAGSSEAKAVVAFGRAIGRADSHFGTDLGRQALADAQAACK